MSNTIHVRVRCLKGVSPCSSFRLIRVLRVFDWCVAVFYRVGNLEEIVLTNCGVSGPGPENEVRKNTPSILLRINK